ncbi:MAG: chromate efflux transporter, partial [Methylomagnum sp.]
VFWPQGFEGHFDLPAALLGFAALLALFRYKAGVIPVIASSGAAGLLLTLLQPWLSSQLGAWLFTT